MDPSGPLLTQNFRARLEGSRQGPRPTAANATASAAVLLLPSRRAAGERRAEMGSEPAIRLVDEVDGTIRHASRVDR